jgi:seryl-tRNA synthetase
LFAFDLAEDVTPDLAADIEKQGAFVSPQIHRVAVRDGKHVSYEIEAAADSERAREKVVRFVESMAGRFRKLPRKVETARSRAGGGPKSSNTYQGLIERGWVVPQGRGRVALRGPALRLLRAIDAECARAANDIYGADEALYPALVSARTLARCGYFSSFPQNVSIVTHLVEDFDTIEEFRRSHEGRTELAIERADLLKAPEACLTPALCYHAYESLEGAQLASGPAILTTAGRCFRYESTNMNGMERLWDFTMREIIFVGTEEQVSGRRRRGFALMAEQLEKWDLEGSIESANDPFFSSAYATKTYWQVRSDLKYELRLAIDPSPAGEPRTVAAGSLNLHEDFFGKTFSIVASNGAPAFTGCLAWGLERFVLACFAQHGFDPSGWPASRRDEVFGAT